ncbi:holo-ACP synthase [Sphaerochaeta sp. PS]|uniref:holo-ACP synthase n=1 Tax=Sphaerochaeta sp. PS TaxID=3076336 RepID=UPI0028A30BEC|nr:holo-ACP synthase [Sphaerochaeta sp. PS]MDT4761211.1 holo-ACP synthase [Sphaerochaeta sp. PS]
MVEGIGIDVVNISRMDMISDGVLKRLFHPEEVSYALGLEAKRKSEYLSGRFAAKEALGKALGSGMAGLRPSDIHTDVTESGKPFMRLYGTAKALVGERTVLVSIAHDPPVASAIVLLQGGPDGSL